MSDRATESQRPSLRARAKRSNIIRTVIWCGVISLFVLHQDFWNWNDRTLLFGFLPVGLGYHIFFTVVTAIMWSLVVKFAWPDRIEEWASISKPPTRETGADKPRDTE